MRKIFKMVDREQLLREQVAISTPPFDYLLGARDYLGHIRDGERRLDAALRTVRTAATEKELVQSFAEIRFLYFALISIHLSLENYLFYGAKGLNCEEEITTLATGWKGLDEVRLLKAVRNRVQHGAMLAGDLHSETRTDHHPDGPGFWAVLRVESSYWQKAVDEMPAKQRPYFENVVAKQADPMRFLVAEYGRSLGSLVDQLDRLLRETYQTEFAALAEVEAELATVVAWLNENGVIDPMRPKEA